MALSSVAYLGLLLHSNNLVKGVIPNFEIILEGLCFSGKLCMVHLAFDRLAGTLFPCTYAGYFSRRKFQCLLASHWVSGVGSSLVILLAGSIRVRSIFHLSTAIVSIFLLIPFYYIILRKIRSNNKKFSCERRPTTFRRMSTRRSSIRFAEHHAAYVCITILSVYVIFSLLPDIGWTLTKMKIIKLDILPHVCYMLWLFNFTLDPLIYIFMKPEIRLKLFRRHRRKPSNASIQLTSVKKKSVYFLSTQSEAE